MAQEDPDEKINLLLVKIAGIQDWLWDALQSLEEGGNLAPDMERYARGVMSDVSYWVDQCTTASEDPPVLVRRMEVQLQRLQRLKDLLSASASEDS